MKRPVDAVSPQDLLELATIAGLTAAECLVFWKRGFGYDQLLAELAGKVPPPDKEQLAFEQFKMADVTGSVN